MYIIITFSYQSVGPTDLKCNTELHVDDHHISLIILGPEEKSKWIYFFRSKEISAKFCRNLLKNKNFKSRDNFT